MSPRREQAREAGHEAGRAGKTRGQLSIKHNTKHSLRCVGKKRGRCTISHALRPRPGYSGSEPSSSERRSRSSSEKASEFESPGAGLGARAGEGSIRGLRKILVLKRIRKCA